MNVLFFSPSFSLYVHNKNILNLILKKNYIHSFSISDIPTDMHLAAYGIPIQFFFSHFEYSRSLESKKRKDSISVLISKLSVGSLVLSINRNKIPKECALLCFFI
mgnify:FL=1